MTRFELFRRNLWLTLRRAPRDRRARRQLGGLIVVIAYLAYLVLAFRSSLADPEGLVVCLVLLVPAVGLMALIRRNNLRASDGLIGLSPRSEPQDEDYLGHRAKLVKALLQRAILVDRAGTEALHREGKVPAESAGASRRRTLSLVREIGLEAELSEVERALLMAQEGSWRWEDVWPRVLMIEDVRVLRWVIGVDAVLTPFEFVRPDLSPALEVTSKPRLVNGNRCMAPYDLRPAQTMAQAMVARCLADGAERGWLEVKDEGEREQLLDLAEKMRRDESSDLLIGATTVGKAGLEQVRWVTQAALRRLWVLTGVIGYLNGPPEGELTLEPQKKKEPVCR